MPATPIPKLLIVDDESAQMEALCDTLETEGYSVSGFTSAAAALAVLREQTFDLVLSDLMMPEMDGIGLLRAALEIDPNLVGIVMTGHGTIDTAVQAMQAGALDYILKPFKLTAILPVLTRALAVRRLRMENIQLHEALGIYKLRMGVALAFDGDTVLRKIADAALEQSRVRGVSILLPTEEGNELGVAVARGEGAACQGTRIPFSAILSAWLERGRELIARSEELAEVRPFSAAPLHDIPDGISVPMFAGGKFVGILHFSSDLRPPVAPGQGKALNILAGVAASAIERVSLLTRLRGAEQRYRRLTENAPDIVFRYELFPQPCVTYINPTVKAITGYAPEEFYADPRLSVKIVHPDDRPLMEKVLRGGSPSGSAINLRFLHRNGNVVWIEQRHMLVEEQNGRLAIECIARDITGRKQMEDELRHAQKMEAIGRLAGGVAHDFNNLLTVINGYSDLLLNEFPNTSQVRENLVEIKRAGEHAAALTRQLLAFGRRQMLQPTVLNVNTIVENNSKIIRRILGEGIEFVTSLDPDLRSVRADTGQIEQILMNLAVNSRDAMPQGGKLTIETRNVVPDETSPRNGLSDNTGRHVMLTMTDTGSGMDPAIQARIFEPFFTTKEPGRGTGLGLSIVYGAVKQSNGTIQVSSEPGKGTAFTIHLPLVDEPDTLPDMDTLPEIAMPLEIPAGSETVLLVEDDEVVRHLLCATLEKAGYRVLSASNGTDALQICTQQIGTRYEWRLGLVLTDLVMPGMSGPALVEALKHRNLGSKVIYISGYVDDAVVSLGHLDPSIPLIQKPFSAGDLLGKVRQTLDETRLVPQA